MPKEGNTSSIALTNRPAGEYNLKDKGRKQNLSHLCFFFLQIESQLVGN